MRVQALQMGFFGGQRIREGQEFEVPDGTKAPWFFEVGGNAEDAKAAPKASKPKAQKPVALSELESKAKTFNEAMAKPDGEDPSAVA